MKILLKVEKKKGRTCFVKEEEINLCFLFFF